MKYLKISFISDRGRVTWKFQNVAEGLANDEIRRALKQLAQCNWLTDSTGQRLWTTNLKRIEAEYVTTIVSPAIVVELI